MITASTTQPLQPGVLTVSIEDMSMVRDIKKAISMLRGVTKVSQPKTCKKPRLYDPETGDYLNKETMKAIEETRKGIGVTTYETFEDFEKAMRSL